MCANRAAGVLDQIMLGCPILLDPLPSIKVVLTGPLVTQDLSYVSLYLVIHKRLSVRW